MSRSAVDLDVKLEAIVRQDGDAWLAFCPALDVTTQSDARDSALGALKEAVQLWFESCVERGVLDEALREAGFDRAKPGQALADSASELEYIEISVPAYTQLGVRAPR